MNQPQAAAQPTTVPTHIALVILFAGIGGMLPTLSRLAATYVNNPHAPPPAYGLYLGLFIFFVIGAVLVVAMGERTLRQALVIGISAPAIINSISAGVRDAHDVNAPAHTAPSGVEQLVDPETLQPVQQGGLRLDLLPLRSALAAEQPPAARTAGAGVPLPRERLFGTRQVEVVLHTSGDAARARVDLRFFDEGGYEIGDRSSLQLRSGARQRMTAPTAARGIIAEISGKRAVVRLPQDSFERAAYRLSVQVGRASDLLWALGFKREVADVRDMTFSETGVTPARPAAQVILELADRHVFGFDASHFQKSIDWQAVHDGALRFAVLRATYGTRTDAKVEEFWSGYEASAGDVALGFYHFYRYRADQPPADQAKAFLDVIAGKRAALALPATVVLAHNEYDDAIEDAAAAAAYVDGVGELVALIEARTGRTVMLFVDPVLAERVPLPAELLQRPVWVKDFQGHLPDLPAGVADYRLWQFGTALLPGVGGVSLLDVFNGDEAAFRAVVSSQR